MWLSELTESIDIDSSSVGVIRAQAKEAQGDGGLPQGEPFIETTGKNNHSAYMQCQVTA